MGSGGWRGVGMRDLCSTYECSGNVLRDMWVIWIMSFIVTTWRANAFSAHLIGKGSRIGQMRPLFHTKKPDGLSVDDLNKENFDKSLWDEFSFGTFNAKTPPSKQQAKVAALINEVSVPADTMDPEWGFLSDQDVMKSVELLKEYVTPDRFKKMSQVLDSRTDNIRMCFENPANPNKYVSCHLR